ncbi:hypothetical protein D3C76_1441380 [compost metagenome]
MAATSTTGAPTVQNSTIEAVRGSPWRVICQIPSSRLASIRTPSRCKLSSGSLQAKGISSIMVTAIAASRVRDQSRPSRIFALQRGQKALWYDFIFGNVKSVSHCGQR